MLIETLKVFCDLVDLKSFSKAAEANFVTQSSISQQIRKLEKLWKCNLIDRGNREMNLTARGEIVYRESKIILERYEAMLRRIGQAAQTVSGTVRAAAILGVGLHELPPYVKQMIQRYPEVNIHLDYMLNDQVYEEVMKKRVELGIVAFPVPRPGIEIIPFRNDRLVIVCHPRHRLAKHKKIMLSKINGLPFIEFTKGIPTRDVIEQFLIRNRVTVNVAMQLNNLEMIKAAVEIDAGISILPIVSVKSELQHKTLKVIEIAGKPLMRSLGILVNRDRPLSIAAAEFINILTS